MQSAPVPSTPPPLRATSCASSLTLADEALRLLHATKRALHREARAFGQATTEEERDRAHARWEVLHELVGEWADPSFPDEPDACAGVSSALSKKHGEVA